ncbi:MAG: hypothetical protein AB8I08_20645 [Sandaracinaceae bacterium]
MSDIQFESGPTPLWRWVLLAVTLMLAGRAMTLAFLARVGGGAEGDPPAGWLMPLVGDAVIGVTALVVAALVLKGRGVAAWTLIVVWNAIAIWDALSAFLVHTSVPWPSFFMIETFGASMFFMAAGMHALCIFLVARPTGRARFFAAA